MTDQIADAPQLEITDVPDARRYEARLGGELAGWVDYGRVRNRLVAVHTEVPPEFGGRGIAKDHTPLSALRGAFRAQPERRRRPRGAARHLISAPGRVLQRLGASCNGATASPWGKVGQLTGICNAGALLTHA